MSPFRPWALTPPKAEMLKKPPDEIHGLKQAYHDAFTSLGWSVRILLVVLVILAVAFALSLLWSSEKLALLKRRPLKKTRDEKTSSQTWSAKRRP
jgi:hypothetical protein